MSAQCCGCIYKPGVGGGGLPVPLKSVNVQVSISGFIADVCSKLTYRSDNVLAADAEFVFPLDDQSAVYKFEAKIQDRTLVGECQTKKQAIDTYNEAVSQGHTAMLLSEDDTAGDIFNCLLGNIPPNTDVVIEFAYVIELSLEADGGVKFSLPTVLNPRYNPTLEDGGATKTPHASSVKRAYDMNIAVEVRGPNEIISVSSEKDKWDVQYKNEEKTSATLNLASKFTFSHDLHCILYYKNPYEPNSMLAKGDPSREGLLKENLLMLSYFPELKDEDFSSNHEFVIIVDRSGSMRGSKMSHARETLMLILKSLPEGSYFNVVSFGSRFEALFPDGSQKYSEATLDLACQLQSKMEANFGGTEILRPLQYVYGIKPMASHSRQIMLLTDGEVYNTQAVISLVKSYADSARVFTFGIGSGASTALVKGVARAGRGKAEFISDNERMQTKVMKCLQAALQATVTDLSLQVMTDSSERPVVIPTELPVLFSGSKLVLYVLVSGTEIVPMKLIGKIGDRAVEFMLPSLQCTVSEDYKFHRLATKAQIKELEASSQVQENEMKISLLSKAANIASKFTAFVAVDKKEGTQQKVIKSAGECSSVTIGYTLAKPMPQASMMYRKSRRALASSVMPETLIADGCVRMNNPGMMGPAEPIYSSSLAIQESSTIGSLTSSSTKKKFKRMQLESTNMPKNLRPTMAADCMADDCTIKPAASTGPASAIALQKFNGTWEMCEELARVLNKSLPELNAASPVADKTLWATALALAWLNALWSSLKDEWMLAEGKALKYIQSHLPADVSCDQLMQQAKSLF